MKPVGFDYVRPNSLDEALALLSEDAAEGTSMLLAGGQSLMPMLNLRLLRPERLIDIRALDELHRVQDDGEYLIYGAGISHGMIEDGIVPDATPGWLSRIAGGIAYRAVRNRGTVGGSLAHADPAADWLSALTALDGEAVLAGGSGTRRVRLSEFVRDAFATDRRPDEILTGLRLPKRSAAARFGYWKFCRKVGEFAKAIGALLVDPERRETRALIGAIEQAPILLNEPEALIDDPREAERMIRSALPDLEPIRLRLHATALERAARLALPERAAA